MNQEYDFYVELSTIFLPPERLQAARGTHSCGLVLTAVGRMASYLAARRATKMDPMMVPRAE